MRRVPQRISPGARARRALLFDLIAALLVAVIVLSMTAGLGVVGFFAFPLFLLGLLWIGWERIRAARRRPRSRASRRPDDQAL